MCSDNDMTFMRTTVTKLITVRTTTMTMMMIMVVTMKEGAEVAYSILIFINPFISFLPQIPTEKFRRIYGTKELNTNM